MSVYLPLISRRLRPIYGALAELKTGLTEWVIPIDCVAEPLHTSVRAACLDAESCLVPLCDELPGFMGFPELLGGISMCVSVSR